MILAAQILLGWFLLGAIGTAAFSIVRTRQKRRDREEMEMAFARAGIRTIEVEYRRHEGAV